MINHTMGDTWESVADFIKDQRPAVFSLPSDRWKVKLEDALTQGFAAGIETGQVYKVTNDRPAEIDLDTLTKAARKVAGAFEDLAKRASETIRNLFTMR